jgi:rubrerythrin
MSADAPRASSLADLYAIAYQIEADAVERYTMLADQMEMHNNPALAEVFRGLARAEGIHRDEIRRMAGDIDVAAHACSVAQWQLGESPESADLGAARYLMTPQDALQLALAAEQAALQFFRELLAGAADPEVRRVAQELVKEEAAHVALCHRLLQGGIPPAGDGPAGDPDPPVAQA